MKHLKLFEEYSDSEIGQIRNAAKVFGYEILDIFNPEDDQYYEYLAKSVEDGMYYGLDPDFNVFTGPFKTLEELEEDLGIFPE
jgi:hypothetical protein